MQWQIGIDEAGRGALAGPICVGAVLYPEDFDWREAFALITKRGEPKLRDSKQLSAQQREILYEYIANHARLRHAHAFVSAESIDAIGIVNAAHEAAAIAIADLGITPEKVRVLLDAGLRVSAQWQQETFVRGDERIPAIAFASIVAKVTRDRHMEELSFAHVGYGFADHKGYGTAMHRLAIRKHGALPLIHRKSFLAA
ncbi:MAG TPA: ribonuclease HII [Candidatus Paceibacterota bacterium]|nr:ribonuclease HII [Candidatus Paceibacterota bacterium]